AVRDGAVLGSFISDQIAAILPKGILNGWQFAVALVLGLVVMGNYGQGDRRRDPRRLLLACALATALPLWMTIWTRGLEFVALQYILTSGLVWLGIVTERVLLDNIVERVAPHRRQVARTLFVGPAEECRTAIEGPAFGKNTDHHNLGFVDVHM